MRAHKTSLKFSLSIVVAAVLSMALLLVVAASADAAVRFTSPTGTNSGASCPEIDPCSLIAAVDGAFTADGDEVVLAPGDYDVGGTMLVIGEAVEMFSIGLPSQVTISSSSGIGILVGHENARVAGFTFEHTGTGAGVLVAQGTLENAIVNSTAGSACNLGSDTLIRDAVCVTSGTNRAGVQLSTSGGPANNVLRNVTAIGTSASSPGLDIQAGTSANVIVDARAVIARGVAGDVKNSALDTGVISQVVMTNSNFDTVTTDDFGGAATATVTANNTNGNQTSAPVFVDADGGDYHQAPTSPTIDAGGAADADTGSKDIDNEVRLIGSAVDIGADEIDNVPPDAPVINTPTDGAISTDNTPTVSGTAELDSLVRVYVDGTLAGNQSANSITGAYSVTTDPLADGTYELSATATDGGGNESAPSAVDYTVDTTAPVVAITAPTDSAVVSDSTPTVSFDLTEANPGSSTCAVDGGTPFACSSGDSMPSLSDGSHTVAVVHTDDVSQTGNDSVTFTVDTTTPTVQITAPTAGSLVNDDTPTIAFSLTEANPDATMCQVDGGTLFACTSGAPLPALADGAHSLMVVHNDLAGQTGSATVNFSTDTTAPTVTVTAPASGSSTNDSTPTISFDLTEANPGSTSCSVDGGVASPCTSGQALGALADGTHTVAVSHTDALGLSATATVSFTVDATGPAIKFAKKPKKKGTKRKVTFTFTSSEPNSTFECKIDKAKAAPCKSKLTKKLKFGKHKITVVAIDQLGNRSAKPATYSFRIVRPKR